MKKINMDDMVRVLKSITKTLGGVGYEYHRGLPRLVGYENSFQYVMRLRALLLKQSAEYTVIAEGTNINDEYPELNDTLSIKSVSTQFGLLVMVKIVKQQAAPYYSAPEMFEFIEPQIEEQVFLIEHEQDEEPGDILIHRNGRVPA